MTASTNPFPADAWAALAPIVMTLERLGINYYVGGSFASSLYGSGRSSLDVDLVADLAAEHVPSLVDSLRKDYYIDAKMILEAIERRSCFNLIHFPTSYKIDIFIPKDRRYDREAFRRKRSGHFEDATGSCDVYFCSPEDILLAKLEWFRLGDEVSENQWRDILGVLKYQHPFLDRTYLEREAAELHVGDLFDRAWKQVEQES
jgi:hypothetical protein